ncbi:MAG: hypothetical protein AB7K52_14930 [Phycisphaerales bacterium]
MTRSFIRIGAPTALLVVAGAAAAQSEIYSNGGVTPSDPGLSTGATTSGGVAAPMGFTWSELQRSPLSESNAVAGFSTHAYAGGVGGAYRFADDFTVPAGRVWRLDAAAFFGYQTGAPLPPGASPFAGVSVRIWSGPPGEPGSEVIFGDASTNRLTGSSATTIFRVFNGVLTPLGPAPDTTRLIWKTDADLGATVLGAGTYWIDWQYTTAAVDGVAFSPPVTKIGQRTEAGWNGQQLKDGEWVAAVDAGKPDFAPDVAQDFPFILSGIDTCTADFNVDGAIDPDDLGDFINCYFGETGVPGTCAAADFNQDGAVDPDDLGDFINIYFGGC